MDNKDEKKPDVKASEGGSSDDKQTAPPAPESKPPTQEPADFAELKTMLAVEQSERRKLTTRLEASEKRATDAEESIRLMKAAEVQAKVAERLEACLRTGRITPAEKEKYDGNLAAFAEESNAWMLEALESRPAGTAIEFGERGTGQEPEKHQDERTVIADKAKQLYAESRQSGAKPMTMREAVLAASEELMRQRGLGYRG